MEEQVQKKRNPIGKILLVIILIIIAAIGGWYIGYKGLIIKHPDIKCVINTETPIEEDKEETKEPEEITFAEGNIYDIEYFVIELNKAFASENSVFANYWIYDTVVATYNKETQQIEVKLTYHEESQTETIDVKTFELNGKKYYSIVMDYLTVEGLDDMGLFIDFYGDLYATNMNKPLLSETIEGIPTSPPLFYEYVMKDETTHFATKEEFDNYKATKLDQPLYETYSYKDNDIIIENTRIILPLHDNTYNALIK